MFTSQVLPKWLPHLCSVFTSVHSSSSIRLQLLESESLSWVCSAFSLLISKYHHCFLCSSLCLSGILIQAMHLGMLHLILKYFHMNLFLLPDSQTHYDSLLRCGIYFAFCSLSFIFPFLFFFKFQWLLLMPVFFFSFL